MSGVNLREPKVVIEDIVVGRTGRAKNSCVGLKVEIKFNRVRDVGIDNCSSFAVAAFVCIPVARWEEADVVTFANHNHRDLWRFVTH